MLKVYDEIDKALISSCPGLSLTGVRPGKFKTFAGSHQYSDLAASTSLDEETRTVRTMHSAKGTEFDNALVWLEDTKRTRRIHHLLDGDKADGEERRVTYVALSRARERLFISVPELTKAEEDALTKLGLEIQHV